MASADPLYVLEIKGDKKQVVVGAGSELLTSSMRVKQLNWVAIAELVSPMRVRAKIRHRHEPAAATIEMSGDGEVLVTFDEPQRAVTPGQAAVFYDGDEVVGGGWIA